jgi:hypothetical protein
MITETKREAIVIDGIFVTSSSYTIPIDSSKMKPRKVKKAWKKFLQKIAQLPE